MRASLTGILIMLAFAVLICAEAAVLLEEARFQTASSLDDAAAKAVAASRSEGTPA